MPDARPAIFLDRDDTLVDTRAATARTPHPGDLADPDLLRLLPGAADGLRTLARLAMPLVIVSNQGLVARDVATLRAVADCNRRLTHLIRAAEGPAPVAHYACPFHPRGVVPRWTREHPWRKPAPGMFLAAAADLHLDLARSWLIGDAQRDADAAVAAGIPAPHALLIATPRFPTFAHAADFIAQHAGPRIPAHGLHP